MYEKLIFESPAHPKLWDVSFWRADNETQKPTCLTNRKLKPFFTIRSVVTAQFLDQDSDICLHHVNIFLVSLFAYISQSYEYHQKASHGSQIFIVFWCSISLKSNFINESFQEEKRQRNAKMKMKTSYEDDWWFCSDICILSNWNLYVMKKISEMLNQLSLYYWSCTLKEHQRIWRGVKRWSIIKMREMCCWWLWCEGWTAQSLHGEVNGFERPLHLSSIFIIFWTTWCNISDLRWTHS